MSSAKKGFSRYLSWNSTRSKWYLIYVPSAWKIFSSHDFISDKRLSSALAYMPSPYSDALTMQPSVLYIPYTISSHEKTGNIINLT